MTAVAGQSGYSEVTNANLSDVIAKLEAIAAQALVAA